MGSIDKIQEESVPVEIASAVPPSPPNKRREYVPLVESTGERVCQAYLGEVVLLVRDEYGADERVKPEERGRTMRSSLFGAAVYE